MSELLAQVREKVMRLEALGEQEKLQAFEHEWSELCVMLEGHPSEYEEQEVAVRYVCDHFGDRYAKERLPLYAWWVERKRREEKNAPQVCSFSLVLWETLVGNWRRCLWEPGNLAGEIRDASIVAGSTMVWCPSGTFMMGSPEDEEGRDENEGQHEVTFERGFWMGQTQVTQRQYREVMRGNEWGLSAEPSRFSGAGDDAPVDNIDWHTAAAYCHRLSALWGVPEELQFYQIRGRGSRLRASIRDLWKSQDYSACPAFRLPTEAEWEYACRAGNPDIRYGELDLIAWWGGWSSPNVGNAQVEYEEADWHRGQRWGTHPVRQQRSNAWGLYDTIGNVWEWCTEYYRSEGYLVEASASKSEHAMRGGCWGNDPQNLRAAFRHKFASVRGENFLGLRVLRPFG